MSHEVAGSSENQDEFVLRMLGHGSHDNPRFFLDLGSGHPIMGNNTIMLEKAGWTGLLFDINGWACTEADKRRGHSKAICLDLAHNDIEPFLVANHVPFVIDYISFDVDDGTPGLIERFPFERYQFRIMTFEHDRYHRGPGFKQQMLARLRQFPQYQILAEDVCFAGDPLTPENPWEDWWINTAFPPFASGGFLPCTRNHYSEVISTYCK